MKEKSLVIGTLLSCVFSVASFAGRDASIPSSKSDNSDSSSSKSSKKKPSKDDEDTDSSKKKQRTVFGIPANNVGMGIVAAGGTALLAKSLWGTDEKSDKNSGPIENELEEGLGEGEKENKNEPIKQKEENEVFGDNDNRKQIEKELEQVFSNYKEKNKDQSAEQKERDELYYQYTRDALNAQGMWETKNFYIDLMRDVIVVEPELKEALTNVLQKAKTQAKDGSIISHEDIQKELGIQDRINIEKELKKALFSYNDQHKDQSDDQKWRNEYACDIARGAINAVMVGEAKSSYKRLMQDNGSDPELKEVLINVLQKAKTRARDGSIISHEDIQKELGLQDHIRIEKELKQAYSDHNDHQNNSQFGQKWDNESSYDYARKAFNAGTVEEEKKYHKQLMENKGAHPALKEKLDTLLRNAPSKLKDEKGNPVSHAQLYERVQEENHSQERSFVRGDE